MVRWLKNILKTVLLFTIVPFLFVFKTLYDYRKHCKECENNVIYTTPLRGGNPKISVIVPIYNTDERFLRECVDSIVNQTFRDLEIILVNDGSTKSYVMEILKEYELKDDRVIVIDKRNGGCGDARNKGLEIARGEYVTFVDHDDFLESNAYEKAYNLNLNYNADVVVFGWNNFTQSQNNKLYSHGFIGEHIPCVLETTFVTDKRKMKALDHIYVWNKLFKRNIIGDVKFILTTGEEDIAFTRKMHAISNSKLFIPECFYKRRMHEHNASAFVISHKIYHLKLKFIRNVDMLLFELNSILKSFGLFR